MVAGGISVMHTICAWCRAVIIPGDPARGVSHGICQACADRLDVEDEAERAAAVRRYAP